MAQTSTPSGTGRSGIAAIASVHGEAPGLKGVSGRLRLQVGDTPAGVLRIEPGGTVAIAADGDASALLGTDSVATLEGLLRGELNPIVAMLRDRLWVTGDVALVVRVLFGLQAGSPWSAEVQKR
jgi:putative sterol carrier protein